MHGRSDQFAKNILRDALSRASVTETEVEVISAAQKIDVWSVPDPARAAERAEMGLLGELSAEPSMFEPYTDTPGLREIRACLRKQLSWHHELERRARAAEGSRNIDADAELEPPRKMIPFPTPVIVSPGRPETVLDLYRFEALRPGLYTAAPGLATRVVVLSELPRTRETLLLRLLGRGRHQSAAIEDLAALPADAWERGVALPLLVHFGFELHDSEAGEEESVNTAEIRRWYEEHEKKLHAEGERAGESKLLLKLLRARFGELPAETVARIQAASTAEIERWGERLVGAATLADVLGEA